VAFDDRAKALFNASVSFRLGDGCKISFWNDPWLDGSSLASSAPDLFKHCTLRNLSVNTALIDGKWMRHFKRNLPPEALSQFLVVHARLAEIVLLPGVPDSISWRWTENQAYSTSSAYNIQFEGAVRHDFIETIWKSEAPLKCRLFAWLANLGKCNTADTLSKKNYPQNVASVLCLSEEETPLHLLATCPVTIRLWKRILLTAGLPANWAPSTDCSSLHDWLLSSLQTRAEPIRKSWISLVHLTWWSIWKERNARIFRNETTSQNQIHSRLIDDARNMRDAGRARAFDLLSRPREPD
jgi:hypothetical protein